MFPRTISGYALAVLAIVIAYGLGKAVYNLFFHPLAKYPGPKIAAITDLWYAFNWTSGRWPFIMSETHTKYGDVVRIAPNELSYSSVSSYREIYGHATKGKKPFLKSGWYDNGDKMPGIVTTRDPADHRQQRQSLSHGFSAQSLRSQEDIVHQYVDLFIEQIGKLGGPNTQGVDIPEAFNWLTFDIIGDLAFGESFDAVITGRTNYWISIIFDGVYWGMLVGLRKRVPLLNLLLPFIVPKKAAKEYQVLNQLTAEKMAKRYKQKDSITRADFFENILRKGDFSPHQLEGQAKTLIVAGSETTATFLSGAVYFLLKNPDCLNKLQAEVRSAFGSLKEITGDATKKLPYLHGVVEEGLRMYPPAPFGLPRISPGAEIDGQFVPAGTIVSTDHWTTMHDSRHWHDADSFRPERWIGEGFGDNKEAFQPFSLGPRGCIGLNLAYLEAKIILAKMVWTYDWALASEDLDWYRDARLYLLWKKPEMRVRFYPRKDVSV